jgi:hypothetical protein
MKVPCPPLLYAHPPEGSEGPELPLKALSERFEVMLAEFRIIWVFMRVSQRHEDDASFEGPEGASVDASKTSEEVCAAYPGEALYPVSDTSATTRRRTEAVTGLSVLEGE